MQRLHRKSCTMRTIAARDKIQTKEEQGLKHIPQDARRWNQVKQIAMSNISYKFGRFPHGLQTLTTRSSLLVARVNNSAKACRRNRVCINCKQQSSSLSAHFRGFARGYTPRARLWIVLDDCSCRGPRIDDCETVDRVMLLRHHGAYTLGLLLRRPVTTRMSSFEGTASLATSAMRSVYAWLGRTP